MERYANPIIAFLIVAHTKPKQLNIFIKQLLSYQGSYIYIHINAKSKYMLPNILDDERVIILPEHYDVRWGDYTQIEVNNALLDFARKNRRHDFYSLHSGMDLAIRPVKEYAEYLNTSNLYAYYVCSKLPNHWQYGGGLARLALYWPRCFRNKLSEHSPLRYLRAAYGRAFAAGIIKGKELPEEYPLYGGADWFTIREDCVSDMFEFLENDKNYQKLFIHSLSGAEIYYVTLFEMLKKDCKVCNNTSLRFADHRTKGKNKAVGSPNICTMEYVPLIERTGLFFARKFDMDIDRNVVEYFSKKSI